MELVAATNNAHKIREIRQILGDRFSRLYTLNELGKLIEVEEDGATFEENAVKKARAVCAATGMAALADDTGLETAALCGAPGVFSARYAGRHGDDAANNALLLKNLEGVADRSARFVTCVALCRPDGRLLTATGSVEGRILEATRGDNGFGYDSLFYCAELGKSFGEATDAEKNSVSHRGRALAALLAKL